MVGQLDHRASQQLQRPAGARPSGGLEQAVAMRRASSLLVSLRSALRPRFSFRCCFEITFNEAALGPVNGRAADSHSSGNIFVAEPAVGREQNLGSFGSWRA